MRHYQIPWKPLLMAAGLMSGTSLLAQPYVTVPVGPNIVILAPGAGTPGLNQIGTGGIVSMVDPDPVGGVFSIAGVTAPVWNMLGDISVNTASVPPTPPVTSLAGLTCGIETYNKTVRTPAEVTAPEANNHARSIGRVTINYTIAPCNNTFTFYIYKKWGNPATTTAGNNYAPPIVGPNCWGTGLITFSVDQVSSDNALDAIGFDQYYWTITNGAGTPIPAALAYTSADVSSITITQTGGSWTTWLAGGAPYTVKCCFGRDNPWDGGTSLTQATVGVTCVTKIMNAAPAAPTFTTPIPTCLAYTSTSFNAAYTPVAGHSYTWSSSCNWILTPGVGTLAVTAVDQNPCTLTLTDVGPCGSNIYSYTVNRTLTGITPTITTGTTCTAPGGSFTIALPSTALGNCTNWTITPVPVPAWTFVDNNAAHSSRTYTIPLGTCAAAFTLTAASCTCPGNSLGVIMNVQPVAPTLTGPACVPYNVSTPTQVYTANTPCGTLSYIWANTLGMTGSSTSNSITYAPLGTASGLVKVNPVGTNGCTGPATSMNVGRLPTTPTVSIPCVNVGLTGSSVFSVTNPEVGSTYNWTFPAAFGTPASPSGTSVTEATLGTPGVYNCSVTNNTPSCGSSTTNFTVTVSFVDPGTGNDYSVATVNNQPTFSTVSVPFAPFTTYQLYNCTGGVAVGAFTTANTYTFTVLGNNNYTITVLMSTGCLARPPCVTSTHHSPILNGGDGTTPTGSELRNDDGSGIVLSPNPNNGSFTLTLLNKVNAASVSLYNSAGQRMGEPQRVVTGTNKVGNERLAPGIYTVQITLDGATITRQVAVERE